MFCEYCVFGKQKIIIFTKRRHNMKRTIEYIHSEHWGPTRVPTKKGAYYMLIVSLGKFAYSNNMFGTFKE